MNTVNFTYRDYDYPINLLLDLRMGKSMPSVSTMRSDAYKDTLNDVLATIPENIRDGLLYRYREKMTQDEIGGRLHVSGARAGQIIYKGLRLLRHPSRRNRLADDSNEEEASEPEHSEAKQPDEPLVMEMGLSARAKNCLLRSGMWTVSDVMTRSPEELAQIYGMGVSSYTEIIERMEALDFDMTAYREYMENWTHA